MGLCKLLEVGNLFSFGFPNTQRKEGNSVSYQIHYARRRKQAHIQEKHTFFWLFKPRGISLQRPEKGDQCCQLDWATSLVAPASQVVLVVKHRSADAGDIRDRSLIPESGRPPQGRNGNPLPYLYLENLTGRRGWWATVHKAAKSGMRLNQFSA